MTGSGVAGVSWSQGSRRVSILLAAMLVSGFAVVAPVAPPRVADAYNGGTSYVTPAAQPCPPPCSFVGDNTGIGLSGFSAGGRSNPNATWWSLTPATTNTYTFRANSISPQGWDNTLIVTTADGTLLAYNDDSYGLDAMTSAALTAGVSYRFALASYSNGQGTANVSVSASAPDAPTGVLAVGDNESAVVAWEEPFDNYAAITEYRIYVNGSDAYSSVTGAPPATVTTVVGLPAGEPVTFEVSAVNGNGVSARSAATDPVYPTGETTTTLSFSPPTATWPDSFDVVAEVASSSTVNSGTVTFVRNGTTAGTVAVVDGVASLNQTLEPGLYHFTADYTGTIIWGVSAANRNITVGKASQSITFDELNAAPYSTGSITAAPVSSSALPVDLVSHTTAVCAVSGTTVTFLTGGTCTLEATQVGDARYRAAVPVVRSFEVTDAPQTISFDAPPDRVWTDATFDLSPTASSGLQVTLASETPDVCTASDATVTLLAAGTCELVASQPGTSTFLPADDVHRSFDVTPATQGAFAAWVAEYSIALAGSTTIGSTGGTGDGSITFDVTSGTDVCSLSGTTLTATARGTCVVTASKASDARHEAATASTDLITVVPGEPTVAIDGPLAAVPGETISVTVTVGGLAPGHSPGAVALVLTGAATGTDVEPASGAVIAPDGRSGRASFLVIVGSVGTLHVDATVGANEDYDEATSADSLAVSVARARPTIEVHAAPTVITGQPTQIVVTVSDLVDWATPGSVRLQLSGSEGATFLPAIADVTLERDDLSGTATFTITAGAEGFLEISVVVAETDTYEEVVGPSAAVIDVVGIPRIFRTVAPTRIVDTRDSEEGKLVAGSTREFRFADLDGLVPPDEIGAASLNITVVDPEANGYVTAYPCGERPLASSLNYSVGQVVGNAALVPVDAATSSVCFYSKSTTHLVVDFTGWMPVDAGYAAIDPVRVFDTRPGHDGLREVPDGPVMAGETLEVRFADLQDAASNPLLPATGVGAVVMNLTAVDPTGPGFVTVYACGERPDSSTLNFVAGRNVGNAVVVPVDVATGSVCFTVNRTTHLVADISGWFPAGLGFTPTGPARAFDTRPEFHTAGLVTVEARRVGGEYELMVQLTDLDGVIPARDVSAVSLNVTVVDPDGNGFVTVHDCDARPMVSSLNYRADQTVANEVIVPVSQDGTVCFYSSRATDLVVDINGWFFARSK